MTVRVLHVTEAIEAGVARHVADVVSRVAAEHHVLVPPERSGGFTDYGALESIESAGASVHLTPMRRSPADPRNARAALIARRLIGRLRPDVVHGHASIGGAVARLAATGTPAARVYTAHGLLPRRSVIAAERALGRLTDAFVAVAPSEADLVSGLRIVPRSRITVIPNGIELEPAGPPTLDLRARLGVGADVPLVGSVGRLAAQKAPEVLVRSFAALARSTDACFVLIGDGPLRGAVAREAGAAGLGARFLHVPGMLNAASVMSQLDVFTLASRYEAGPYSPLEAMRAGVPVVLTDVVGNRDTVLPGETGLLVPPDDPDALAGAAVRLLGDPGLGGALTAAARERLVARFDIRTMAERTEALYRQVARGSV